MKHYLIGLILTLSVTAACSETAQTQGDQNAAAISYINEYASQRLKKDEFETTQAYQQRFAAFSGKEFVLDVPATMGVPGQKVFTFDADSQNLSVKFFGHSSVGALRFIDSESSIYKTMVSSGILGIQFQTFVLKRESEPSRQYEGQNAMGAKAIITQRVIRDWSVGLVNAQSNGQFVPLEKKLSIDAQRARKVVDSARWRLVVASALLQGQVDFILSDSSLKKATIDNPTEIDQIGKLMMVLLRKAELVDPTTNEVLLTFLPGGDAPTTPIEGSRVLLGVLCPAITKEFAAITKMTDLKGCMVARVTPDSVAMKSGIVVGDAILSIDDKPIISPEGLQAVVRQIAPGQKAKILIWRNGGAAEIGAQF